MNIRAFGYTETSDYYKHPPRCAVVCIKLEDGTWGRCRIHKFNRWRPAYNRITSLVNAVCIFAKEISTPMV